MMTARAIRIPATILALIFASACAKEAKPEPAKDVAATTPVAAEPPPAPAAAAKRVDIAVTENGFEPATVSVPAGQPVILVFTRKTDKTCAKEVVLQIDDNKIEKPLPLDQPVEVAVTFPKAGELEYACGMDMIRGVIRVE